MNLEKFANAFVPGAAPSGLVGGAARGAVDNFREKHGGLWVGGKVSVNLRGVTFVPNAMNRALNKNLEDTFIPLEAIRSVRREFGVLTGIVVVEHAQGTFRFRCFGARQVAATMARQLAPV